MRAPLPDLRDEFARRAQEGSIKGEIAIVIDEPSAAEEDAAQLDAAEVARVRAAELPYGKLEKQYLSCLDQLGLVRGQ